MPKQVRAVIQRALVVIQAATLDGRSVGRVEVSEALGISTRQAHYAISRLRDDHKIIRTGVGLYKAPRARPVRPAPKASAGSSIAPPTRERLMAGR